MNTTRKEFLRSAGGSSTYTQAPVVGSRRVNADFTGPKA